MLLIKEVRTLQLTSLYLTYEGVRKPYKIVIENCKIKEDNIAGCTFFSFKNSLSSQMQVFHWLLLSIYIGLIQFANLCFYDVLAMYIIDQCIIKVIWVIMNISCNVKFKFCFDVQAQIKIFYCIILAKGDLRVRILLR